MLYVRADKKILMGERLTTVIALHRKAYRLD